jgi:RluA family pseudouridine synthase
MKKSLKQVPFYANHEDGMHCMLAVYRSIIDYFLHRKISWDELEKITGYEPGRAAWSIKALVHMLNMGFDIRMIEPFDYARYLKEGKSYLEETFNAEEKQWLYEHSNILELRPQIAPFLQQVTPEHRSAALSDIDDMLADDRLVFVTVNSRVLAGKEGFFLHAILVIGTQGDDYIVHDPGGKATSPQENRHVSRELLWQAMGGENNRAEVTGFKLGKGQNKKRLDVYVVEQKPSLSRAFAAKLCDQGKVLVNGKSAKPGHRLHDTDTVEIDYDEAVQGIAPAIDLPVIYEDDDCMVINKPVGVLTHAQGALSAEATVASFLRSKLYGLSGDRAGIVHRLDRATSGIIIGAKNQAALSFLQKQFAQRSAKKTYIAVVHGQLVEPEAVIDMPIERNPKAPATFRVGANGKQALTRYKVLQTTDQYSLIELKPETGRTHQLRVHLAELGHPIVGDPLYGSGTYGDRLYLHAKSLEITLPNREHKLFEAPLPKEFEELLA